MRNEEPLRAVTDFARSRAIEGGGKRRSKSLNPEAYD